MVARPVTTELAKAGGTARDQQPWTFQRRRYALTMTNTRRHHWIRPSSAEHTYVMQGCDRFRVRRDRIWPRIDESLTFWTVEGLFGNGKWLHLAEHATKQEAQRDAETRLDTSQQRREAQKATNDAITEEPRP